MRSGGAWEWQFAIGPGRGPTGSATARRGRASC